MILKFVMMYTDASLSIKIFVLIYFFALIASD